VAKCLDGTSVDGRRCMVEAAKGFRRLKAYKQFPIPRATLVTHADKQLVTKKIEPQADAA